jgi:hypothetical protein
MKIGKNLRRFKRKKILRHPSPFPATVPPRTNIPSFTLYIMYTLLRCARVSTIITSQENQLKFATYDEAVALARLLDMDPNHVWNIIRVRKYAYFSDLKVAVLNYPHNSASWSA